MSVYGEEKYLLCVISIRELNLTKNDESLKWLVVELGAGDKLKVCDANFEIFQMPKCIYRRENNV